MLRVLQLVSERNQQCEVKRTIYCVFVTAVHSWEITNCDSAKLCCLFNFLDKTPTSRPFHGFLLSVFIRRDPQT
jgi:hypothetical protein